MNRPAPPVEVSYKNMRFLITHNPTNATLDTFIEDLKQYGATTVVRVCEVTYDKTPLEKDGITVMDWAFDDGAPPPTKIVDDWLNLLKTKFREDPGCCVAVHCVAGLGRAPVLVALALIEGGMKYEEAVQFIRQYVQLTSRFSSVHQAEAQGSDQQQAADLPGEIPLQTATTLQRPSQTQEQVLCDVMM
ncbi:protein tyrosine phosphatase type IVA 3-like isoform X1 [Oncorhynchus kisutch]|uniref:protein tyrosine phosphatase type IVA 3-like isoform X1 n=1 Tax=Oncorhynchus kisutch TaxID=8019 RepID=UPI0012DD7AD1|nr:protein tyrosine phosphatase type IVA 3-like isoform X1 [Oncorhynchus kisutch]XP_031676719.1 protein tyrosine phosphatase type IVA 3-like isoform X1 [Oncorhynchus kisutch]